MTNFLNKESSQIKRRKAKVHQKYEQTQTICRKKKGL